MDRLLPMFLGRLVRRGSFTVTTAGGKTYTFGDRRGPPVAVRFTSAKAQRAVLLDPELKLGEAYMDGTFVVERGSIVDVLAILFGQERYLSPVGPCCRGCCAICSAACSNSIRDPVRATTSPITTTSTAGFTGCSSMATSNIAALISSSRTSRSTTRNLAKKRHLAAKLCIAPGAKVLDIGCGWGGLALYLAEIAGAQVTGITLSQEQYKRAQNRALERGLSRDTAFRLVDYRDVDGRYDRIVSVGMFEHVGVGFYDVFFRRCAELLADDGVALLHTIGRSGPPSITNPWIAKYVFPGGYIPALSEVLPAVQRAGLLVSDVEILQLHYAETLKAWRERFLAHRDEVVRLYDQRFVRMWEFYLACSEMAFRESDMVVFQIQLAKHKGVTPATRDYIAREEARLRARERGSAAPLRLAGE